VTLQTNIDDEPTANSVVALATLPPSKMARKITSLQNKLVCESDRRVAVESKYSDKKLECKAAEQQLRQEKRASNTLINIEKEKAAEVLVAARALEEASEETVESAMERMAELTIECNRKVREER
jgi:low affinity Fe/Cu permease